MVETKTPDKKAPDRVEVTLKRELEHGGKIVPAGSKLLLRPDQVERLKKHTGKDAYI